MSSTKRRDLILANLREAEQAILANDRQTALDKARTALRLAENEAARTGPSIPTNCPSCHGQREWSGTPGVATCFFCGSES